MSGQLGLQWRLSITTTSVLALFLFLAGIVLDRSFQNSVLAGTEQQLRQVIYSVMGGADEVDGVIVFSDDLGEPRLSQPDSGLYAAVYAADNKTLWRSLSAKTSNMAFALQAEQIIPGEFQAVEYTNLSVERLALDYLVIWEAQGGESLLRFQAATDLEEVHAQVNKFRRGLLFGLSGIVVLFIFVQVAAVRWGLRPVRVMADEVKEMEAGQRSRLTTNYPQELNGLAKNLDRFIEHESLSRSRYRNAMDDLAHSLKTPLTVIRNALEDSTIDRVLIKDQIDRMETTVAYQLSRAAVAGPVVVGQNVGLLEVVQRLVRALENAYREKHIEVEIVCLEPVFVKGDERDLMEMLGNLLENAYKYCSQKVKITLKKSSTVCLLVEDDGPGIDKDLRDEVIARGARADSAHAGHGIGLSVVVDLVSLYNGQLEIGESNLGGALVRVELP